MQLCDTLINITPQYHIPFHGVFFVFANQTMSTLRARAASYLSL